ncbi:hypothetical protein [Microbispora sp. H10836]|uniref:hypothetical protein n=1 Tax=Microbispora sp. H10836 TaxID=2729106 RepID=UPI00147350DB|nr:hypothetical protein [Microbispora sp. H10836]
MARLRDFLQRFRPAGVPGAAAPAGVPADYAVDQAAELEAVFSALEETWARCAHERLRARSSAEETRTRARAQAAAVLSAARLEAEAARAEAASAARRTSEQESDALLRDATGSAGVIRRRAAARMPEMVARVVAEVRSLARDVP